LADQLQQEKGDAKQLEEEESRYWKEYNEYKRQLLDLEECQRR
jgi:beclin 1